LKRLLTVRPRKAVSVESEKKKKLLKKQLIDNNLNEFQTRARN
jgi:hypothetical protein